MKKIISILLLSCTFLLGCASEISSTKTDSVAINAVKGCTEEKPDIMYAEATLDVLKMDTSSDAGMKPVNMKIICNFTYPISCTDLKRDVLLEIANKDGIRYDCKTVGKLD